MSRTATGLTWREYLLEAPPQEKKKKQDAAAAGVATPKPVGPSGAPSVSRQHNTGLYVYRPSRVGKDINDCAKPIPLLKHLIHWYGSLGVTRSESLTRRSCTDDPFGVVLDLCGGSGNASRAALLCGQRPVYVDSDKEQALKACNGLRQLYRRLYGDLQGRGLQIELDFDVRDPIDGHAADICAGLDA